ncbi:MAG: hypothetical protein ACFFBE_18480, partial [Promethearchaeota archaeon]
MLPHKYVALNNRKQEIFGIELVELHTNDGIIPVVATTELDQITIFWWKPNAGVWGSWTCNHDRPICTGDKYKSLMWDVTSWNWSHRVGLTAGNGEVFLIYKRSILNNQGLFLDRLVWDSATEELSPIEEDPESRLINPELFGDRVGFYIWACCCNQKIYILAQTISKIYIYNPFDPINSGFHVEVGSLCLFYADTNTDLSQSANWDKLVIRDMPYIVWEDLFSGGFDFDAVLDNQKIYCIYRRKAYPFSIKDPEKIREDITSVQKIVLFQNDIFDDEDYAPVYIREINLVDNTISAPFGEEGIPGGPHPRIQNINPFLWTCDRYSIGSLDIEPAKVRWEGVLPPFQPFRLEAMHIVPHILCISKLLFMNIDGVWARGYVGESFMKHFYIPR